MYAGFIFVVKNESRWIIPGCVVGQANDRLIRLTALGNGFSIPVHHGFVQSFP